ncbi:hypothetical protein SAMN06295879_0309 [Agreia bicolorata]|uniref:Uncharacterized protein n=1 Tax=Agreia bicolorata TaxID=110935 RepID=A0A1T4WXF7_9MICO|nr:hypothetical protein SAMN06295879_0309 [Agreia bicolorata]
MHASSLARLSSVALAAALVVLAAPPAQAAPAEPLAWGPQGTVGSDSSVTVHWNADGNPGTSIVPRDASQVLPFTGGKTYDDVRPQVNEAYAQTFNPESPLGGLSMTVSQTTNLVNQAVTLDVTGLPGFDGVNAAGVYLQVFQCWGAPLDGKPDPAATNPDPRTCQTGVGTDRPIDSPDYRTINRDPLVKTGELADQQVMPFLTAAGVEAGAEEIDAHLNRATTNEIPRLVSSNADGTASRTFEVQTGIEAPDLACGLQPDAPSSQNCWLVAVPIISSVANRFGASNGWPSGLTPSLWAQRMQVRLGFQDVASGCEGGNSRILAAGSELATYAMSSWVPGLCGQAKIATGYTQLSDDQARRQLESGANDFIFTSQAASASTAAIYTPSAVAGTVIGLTIDYRPCGFYDGETVEHCGYPDRATAEAEWAKAGQPITDLRLNARLVAKLLTQTYQVDSPPGTDIGQKAPWAINGMKLELDPEFLALNPQLKYHVPYTRASALTRLETEGLKSDAAARLWAWILGDADGKSFLNGCPDADGITVNPWYSTRSYDGCQADAARLEVAAAAKRDATVTPTGFARDKAASYPPSASAYPQSLFAESTPVGSPDSPESYVGPATMVDLYPSYADQAATARVGFRSQPSRGSWCTNLDGGCFPSRWKPTVDLTATQGTRTTIVVTDSANAARYQLPTATLCDDAGTHCVGATSQSLQKAVDAFGQAAPGAVRTAPAVPDYAGGAYPLTNVVYAAAGTAKLTTTQAAAYAGMLDFITTTGQTPGQQTGQLKPGFAPLTATLSADAAASVAALRSFQPAATTKPAAATAAKPAAVTAGPVVPKTVAPPAASVAAPTTPSPASTAAPVAGGITPITEVGFPQFGLVGGLAAALGAGLFAPVLARRRKALDE